jgi:hypothetical protein
MSCSSFPLGKFLIDYSIVGMLVVLLLECCLLVIFLDRRVLKHVRVNRSFGKVHRGAKASMATLIENGRLSFQRKAINLVQLHNLFRHLIGLSAENLKAPQFILNGKRSIQRPGCQ